MRPRGRSQRPRSGAGRPRRGHRSTTASWPVRRAPRFRYRAATTMRSACPLANRAARGRRRCRTRRPGRGSRAPATARAGLRLRARRPSRPWREYPSRDSIRAMRGLTVVGCGVDSGEVDVALALYDALPEARVVVTAELGSAADDRAARTFRASAAPVIAAAHAGASLDPSALVADARAAGDG